MTGRFHSSLLALTRGGDTHTHARTHIPSTLTYLQYLKMAVVEKLPVPVIKLGEGPFWLEDRNALLFVDVFDMGLRIYEPKTKKLETIFMEDPDPHHNNKASLVIPVEGQDDLYLVGLGTSLAVLSWQRGGTDGRFIKPKILQKVQDPHFNDGKVDSKGRLWVGTVTYLDEKGVPAGHEDANLYKLDLDLTFTKMVDKMTLSNGMAWTRDNKRFYFADSKPALIYGFDFDEVKGEVSNQTVAFSYAKAGLTDQVPDGLTIDRDGNLWIACFGGAQVIQVDPRAGKLLRQVHIPSPHVTSVTFGGPEYDVLYVTSGTLRLTPDQLKQYPEAGGTFAITGLGAKGYKPMKFRGNLDKLRALAK